MAAAVRGTAMGTTRSRAPDLPGGQDERRAQLLWRLKGAYQRATGEPLQVIDLLTRPDKLQTVLRDALTSPDAEIRAIANELRAYDPNRAPLIGTPAVGDHRSADNPTDDASTFTSASTPQRGARSREEATTTKPGGAESFRNLAVGGAAIAIAVAALAFVYRSGPVPTTNTAPSALPPTALSLSAVEPQGRPTVAAKVPSDHDTRQISRPAAHPLAKAETILRIHGSNTVGEHLTPALISAFLRSRGAEDATRLAGAAPQESVVRSVFNGDGGSSVEVFAHGSATAFVDLERGVADIGQSSRRIKPEEVEALRPRFGDLTSPAAEHVIGLDGLAIIVHRSNTMTRMTLADVARIFSGEIQDWSQLGGSAGPIHLVARDDKSGTFDTFKALVLEPSKLALAGTAQRVESSKDLTAAVALDPQAIGFVSLSYVEGVKPLAIATEADAVALLPTSFTVATEDYPLARRLYYYAPIASTNPWVSQFIEFALSPAGQKIVEEVGFVSLSVHSERPPVDASMPTQYIESSRGAERLSVNFRFESGSDSLDSKALRDLDRVVTFLQATAGRQVSLLGFTDASGQASANRALSERRARVVQQELTARGIAVREVVGLGAAAPVAPNDTAAGKNKNRRVEVWVR